MSADALELARVWSASLPPVFDGNVERWRPWNGVPLNEYQCSSAFGAFFEARQRGESLQSAVQAAYEWLGEHVWPPGKTCTREGLLVDQPPFDESYYG